MTSTCNSSNCKPISLTVEALKLVGIIHYPHEKSPFPWVIMSHGLLSDKESSKYISLAEEIAKEGHYHYILDGSQRTVIFAEDSLNVTDAILKKLEEDR